MISLDEFLARTALPPRSLNLIRQARKEIELVLTQRVNALLTRKLGPSGTDLGPRLTFSAQGTIQGTILRQSALLYELVATACLGAVQLEWDVDKVFEDLAAAVVVEANRLYRRAVDGVWLESYWGTIKKKVPTSERRRCDGLPGRDDIVTRPLVDRNEDTDSVASTDWPAFLGLEGQAALVDALEKMRRQFLERALSQQVTLGAALQPEQAEEEAAKKPEEPEPGVQPQSEARRKPGPRPDRETPQMVAAVVKEHTDWKADLDDLCDKLDDCGVPAPRRRGGPRYRSWLEALGSGQAVDRDRVIKAIEHRLKRLNQT